ncbi:MAG: hypothetical protein ACOC8N_07610, partial [Spirochaetota bacterium]
VIFATPILLTRVLSIRRPTVRVRYEYRDHGSPRLEEVIRPRITRLLDARGTDGREGEEGVAPPGGQGES